MNEDIPYATVTQSFWYIWTIVLDAGDTSAFEGDNELEGYILTAVYVLASFVLIIHLFNMLIAIMGDTFNKNNLVENQLRIKDHLSFVLDNWYLNDIGSQKFNFRDKSQIKYIMTAFQVQEKIEDT